MYPEGNKRKSWLTFDVYVYTLEGNSALQKRLWGKLKELDWICLIFLGNKLQQFGLRRLFVCYFRSWIFQSPKSLTCSPKAVHSSGFPAKAPANSLLLNLRTMDILGWMILCWRGGGVAYVQLHCTLGFLAAPQPLLEVINTLPQITTKPLLLSQCDHPPVEDHWLGLS